MSGTEEVGGTRPTFHVPRKCPKCGAPWDYGSQIKWKCQYCGYRLSHPDSNADLAIAIGVLLFWILLGLSIMAIMGALPHDSGSKQSCCASAAPDG
jgi:uncharacterized protein (DUF983 family)